MLNAPSVIDGVNIQCPWDNATSESSVSAKWHLNWYYIFSECITSGFRVKLEEGRNSGNLAQSRDTTDTTLPLPTNGSLVSSLFAQYSIV